MISTLHFLQPAWLLGLVPLAIVMTALYRRRTRFDLWNAVCDPHLLAALRDDHADAHPSSERSEEPSRQRSSLGVVRRIPVVRRLALVRLPWSLALGGSCAALAMIALAGPAWTEAPAALHESDSARVIVLDLSRSMTARDIAPNRIFMARLKLRDLLERSTARTGLIAFAAESFVVAPLSDDAATITAMVPALDPAIMPSQGTLTGPAINEARRLLERDGVGRGEVVLVTDAADFEPGLGAAVERLAPHRLSVLVVASPEGATLTDAQGRPVLLAAGSARVSRPDLNMARRLAESSGGVFTTMREDNEDIVSLLGSAARGQSGESADGGASAWRDEGPWLVLALVPIVAFGLAREWFRGVFAAIAPLPLLVPLLLPLMISLLMSAPVEAADRSSWWRTADQRAAAAYAAGRYAQAARLFQAPAWRAMAHYRDGDLESALQALTGDDIRSLYNRATVLAQIGHLDAALETFDAVLARDPRHADAAFNRALVARLRRDELTGSPAGASASANDGESTAAMPAAPPVAAPAPSESAIALADDPPDAGGNSPMENSAGGAAPEDAGLSPAQTSEPSGAGGGAGGESGGDDSSAGSGNSLAGDSGYSADGERVNTSGGGAGGSVDLDAEGISSGERRQALDQWLRRIPDDPSGLIRRKMLLIHKRRAHERGASAATAHGAGW